MVGDGGGKKNRSERKGRKRQMETRGHREEEEKARNERNITVEKRMEEWRKKRLV